MLFCDTDLIKVIAGVRRCGKSSLLDLLGIAIESKRGCRPRLLERQLGKQRHGHMARQDAAPASLPLHLLP